MGLARRLAAGVLQRVAREVERLSVVIEPVRGAIALRAPGRAETSYAREPLSHAPESSSTVLEASAHPPEPPSHVTEADAPEPPSTQPIAEAPLHPPAVAIPLGIEQVDHLRGSIEPQLAFLRESSAWQQAEDPAEVIRRMRVATRRLRAFARLFAPMLGDKRARKLERRLRTITRGLGPMREWDVLLGSLRVQHATAEPLARAALEHVMGWAQTERRKAVRRADAALAEVDVMGLVEALDAELDRVCGRLLRLDEQLPTTANVLLEPELARAFEGMPKPRDDADMAALHDVRIRAKRLRYALELLEPTLPEDHRSLRPLLKRVQASIGEHREAAQLTERLHERRIALDAKSLSTLAGALEAVETASVGRIQHAFELVMRALDAMDTNYIP